MTEKTVTPKATPEPELVAATAAGRVEAPAADIGLSAAVVISKVQPPLLQRPVVERPRLLGWLDERTRQRVVVLSAEAGYGKSTLLGDFARRSKASSIWYRLETSDKDWMTFLGYLVAAVRQKHRAFGGATEALLRHVASMGPTRDVVVATFLSDLAEIGDGEVVLILDDLHLVDGSEDVAYILGRLFEQAPEGFHFVLSGRGRPWIPLGRIAAQGRLAELSTRDLRFTRTEIEEFFASQGQTLRRETCDVVEERTEGWVASLQLVAASIASSRPEEVDGFIKALSGARGSLYDFLAEEVLARLATLKQRVLIHAALLDRIKPELVAAALSATPKPVSEADVEACLRDVESIGLLTYGQDASDGARIHPLLRQFLIRQLEESASDGEVQAMHLAIAGAAEDIDWLVAGKHYAAGGHPEEAMRVLGGAASQALGSGAWGAAAEIIDSMPDTTPPPAVQVIRARALTSDGDPEAALDTLSRIDRSSLTLVDGSLLRIAEALALNAAGEAVRVKEVIDDIALNSESPSPLREVAAAWRQMLLAAQGGSITAATESLTRLGSDLRESGLSYFAGVAYHNAATGEIARGETESAARLALEAISLLSKTKDETGILTSTKTLSATAAAESGDWTFGLHAATEAARTPGSTSDAIAEAAYLSSIVGDLAQARYLLTRLKRGDARGARELSARAQGCYARAAYAVATSNPETLSEVIDELQTIEAAEMDAESRLALLTATLAYMRADEEAATLAQAAISTIERQNAWRWAPRAHLLEAASCRDPEALRVWLDESGKNSPLALLENAESISGSLDLLDPTPNSLERSVVRAPRRWIPVFRRQLSSDNQHAARVAASLVARFGGIDDAPELRAFDQSRPSVSRRRGYVAKLIRRISPTARIHDLGPTSFTVGDRLTLISETRRKPASLLLFLVTRPQLSTPRERLMECLWPSQTPRSGLNSLHQTLFFLRRDIEPWYEDGSTADYVRMESDLVFLDAEMFQIDSVAFVRQAADVLSAGSMTERGPELLRLYTGRFAPEFEYEDWADEWRSQVHGSYLHLAHATATELLSSHDVTRAVGVLTGVAAIDPLAFELRAMLVRALAITGATDAAFNHYAHLAATHDRELGGAISSFEKVVSGSPLTP